MRITSEMVEYLCAMPFYIGFSLLSGYFVWFRHKRWLAFNDWLTKNNGALGESQRAFARSAFGRWFARIITIPFVLSALLMLFWLLPNGIAVVLTSNLKAFTPMPDPLTFLCVLPFPALALYTGYIIWFRYEKWVDFNDTLTENNGSLGEAQRAFMRSAFGRWFFRFAIIPFVVLSLQFLYWAARGITLALLGK